MTDENLFYVNGYPLRRMTFNEFISKSRATVVIWLICYSI